MRFLAGELRKPTCVLICQDDLKSLVTGVRELIDEAAKDYSSLSERMERSFSLADIEVGYFNIRMQYIYFMEITEGPYSSYILLDDPRAALNTMEDALNRIRELRKADGQ